MNAQISEEVHTLCRRYQALALSEDPTTLTVALSEEAPQGLLAALRFATGKRIHLEQWPAARLELALNQHHEPLSAPLAAEEDTTDIAYPDDGDAPVVQFINQTLRLAIQRRDVMEALAPTGPVYQAGTLSGNPIAMAAGYACLTEVSQVGVHQTLTELTEMLAAGLLHAAQEGNIPLVVNNVGGMFGLFFTDAPAVTCYQDVMQCDVERFKRFFHLMLEEGVYLAPSAFEAGFMSVAHSKEDIQRTIDAARRCFAKL